VAHVGTVDEHPDTNQLVKQKFREIMPNNARGFNPSGAWTRDDRNNLTLQIRGNHLSYVVALVTTNGNFYSLLVGKYPNHRDLYVIGGCVPVPPWDHLALTNLFN